ncbi:hypothetical protein [Moorena bouillonii]|uniref:hypothetical protein n=1 Tax=Moorena bouillonii TaxID=207920 RepID=UPI001181471D|nr:hypothetical protein [Moorena bouillonii]
MGIRKLPWGKFPAGVRSIALSTEISILQTTLVLYNGISATQPIRDRSRKEDGVKALTQLP